MALQKKLTFGLLVLLGVNAIIGSGIFFAPGFGAKYAGPASLISWVLAAGLSILIGLCFAELSGMFPKAGGVYEYAKKSFGSFIGFTVGWSSWIVSNLAIAMLTIAGIQFLSLLIPMDTITQLIVALLFVLGFNYISYKGIGISGKILLGFSAITIVVIIMVIIGALPSVNLNNLQPFYIFGQSSIFVALFLIMETFFGWEAISFLSEETKNARKVLPKVMILSTILVAVFVLITVFVSFTAVPWYKLSYSNVNSLDDYYTKIGSGALEPQSMPLIIATTGFFSGPVLTIMIILAFLNIIGSAAAWIIATPRLIFAMARDNNLPVSLSTVHSKYKTPHYAIALQTVITILVLLSGSYELLLKVGLPLAIIMYSIVVLAIPRLRFEMPKLPRTFRIPYPRLLTGVAVAMMIIMLIFGSDIKNIILGFTLFLLGVPLYFIGSLGYRKELIKRFSDVSAYLTSLTYKFLVEEQIMDHVLNYLDDITINRVLDVGCGIGRFTNKIAKHCIPPSGKVYGIDFSNTALTIGKKYAEAHDVKNVEFIEADLYNLSKNKEVDRKLRNLDAVVGIGVLQYLTKIGSVLKGLNKRMRQDGKIYFVDYDFFSHIFDKPWIEHDQQIRKIFREAGFDIKIWRQKRLLWTYVHIYGNKI